MCMCVFYSVNYLYVHVFPHLPSSSHPFPSPAPLLRLPPLLFTPLLSSPLPPLPSLHSLLPPLLVAPILLPNRNPLMLCDGVRLWRRAVLPPHQDKGVRGGEVSLLLRRNHPGYRVPTPTQHCVQGLEGMLELTACYIHAHTCTNTCTCTHTYTHTYLYLYMYL